MQGWVYVAVHNANQILMINKTTGKIEHTMRTQLPTALTVFGKGAQPKSPGEHYVAGNVIHEICRLLQLDFQEWEQNFCTEHINK